MAKVGPRHLFKQTSFWAEEGLICLEDINTGEFKVLTRADAAARAIHLNEELRYMEYPDERTELCNCVVAICEAVKEAKNQGDPTDPKVMKQKLRDLRKVSMITGSYKPMSLDNAYLLKPVAQASDRFSKLKI